MSRVTMYAGQLQRADIPWAQRPNQMQQPPLGYLWVPQGSERYRRGHPGVHLGGAPGGPPGWFNRGTPRGIPGGSPGGAQGWINAGSGGGRQAP